MKRHMTKLIGISFYLHILTKGGFGEKWIPKTLKHVLDLDLSARK
jgi:hypothetical protein